MRWVRGRGTKPEMIVRRLVHGAGYHYRLHWRARPEAADLVFRGRKLAIFVHGCFWHRHADPNCPLARLPKSKLDFWDTKLETNRKRDERNLARLAALGWGVLEIWECQTKNREKLRASIGSSAGRDLRKWIGQSLGASPRPRVKMWLTKKVNYLI